MAASTYCRIKRRGWRDFIQHISQNDHKIPRKTTTKETIFINVTGLQIANLLKRNSTGNFLSLLNKSLSSYFFVSKYLFAKTLDKKQLKTAVRIKMHYYLLVPQTYYQYYHSFGGHFLQQLKYSYGSVSFLDTFWSILSISMHSMFKMKERSNLSILNFQ